jgi:hypothetical protein
MIDGIKETVSVAWCDNGMVDGKFTEMLSMLLLNGEFNNTKIDGVIRVQGNQIGRQRDLILNIWENENKSDWLLCLDSDIVLNFESLKTLFSCADKNECPVITGVYFISYENEKTLMEPRPSIFYDRGVHAIENIHPLPENQLMKIGCGGLGFMMFHRSVLEKLREKYGHQQIYNEEFTNHSDIEKTQFVGEDISFFRKLTELDIPIYAHTGALVQHMKKFSYDINYYAMYWDNINKIHK